MRHLAPLLLVLGAPGCDTSEPVDVDGAIMTHAEDEAAHHAKTTDASELTEGVLDPARLPDAAATDTEVEDVVDAAIPAMGGAASVQEDFDAPVDVDSTDYVELLSLPVMTDAPSTVVLNGHVYLERASDLEGRYYVMIAEGDCEQDALGTAFWRPLPGESGYAGTTVPVTAATSGVDGGTTLVMCASKLNEFDGDLVAYTRGMTASW